MVWKALLSSVEMMLPFVASPAGSTSAQGHRPARKWRLCSLGEANKRAFSWTDFPVLTLPVCPHSCSVASGLALFFFNVYLFILREQVSRGGAERGRERIPSTLHDVSPEPDMGINPTNQETMTRHEIKSQTLNRLSCSGAPGSAFTAVTWRIRKGGNWMVELQGRPWKPTTELTGCWKSHLEPKNRHSGLTNRHRETHHQLGGTAFPQLPRLDKPSPRLEVGESLRGKLYDAGWPPSRVVLRSACC